jgi:hypothetical protein
MNSKFGFWPRRTATDFEPASIAQLIQVEPASLAKERFNALLQAFAAASAKPGLKFRAPSCQIPKFRIFFWIFRLGSRRAAQNRPLAESAQLIRKRII